MEEYSFFVVIIIMIVGIMKIVSSIKEKKKREQAGYYSQNINGGNNAHNQINDRRSVQSVDRQNPSNNNHATVGPVIYYGNSNHNASDVEFKFKYVFKNGGWRAYIIRQPSFNGRDEALAITHRWRDPDNNMYYVCWDTPVTQIKDMQIISKAWADNILEYIATGKRFGPQ
ncbi:MAG: hypothetical protein ACI4F4_04615 [Lachnospiraceae bacterium]